MFVVWSAVVAIVVGVALAQGAGSQDQAQPPAAHEADTAAQGPNLNSIERGTLPAEFAVERIGSIPTYVVLFEACHNGPALGPSRINPSHA